MQLHAQHTSLLTSQGERKNGAGLSERSANMKFGDVGMIKYDGIEIQMRLE